MSKKRGSTDAVIKVRTPAKVNLGLRILGKRPDGYHNLLTLMVPVGLCDDLRLECIPRGIELLCPNSDLPTGEGNLVYRAAELILDECRWSGGVRIELIKRIPTGAGLGGGSSDAAATLLALNELMGWPLAPRELAQLGVRLGADVPFFLLGQAALAQGIGELLTPLENLPTLWTVLIYPGFQVSTRWAYGNLALTSRGNGSKFNPPVDHPGEQVAAYRRRLLDRQRLSLEELCPFLINDFEPVVIRRYPQLQELKHGLLNAGARAAVMSGSGPTVVGLFDSQEAAGNAQRDMWGRDGATCFVASTVRMSRSFAGMT
jgi:4-diphosphocytidyl-2-C-methyl-D-erythritol kinase